MRHVVGSVCLPCHCSLAKQNRRHYHQPYDGDTEKCAGCVCYFDSHPMDTRTVAFRHEWGGLLELFLMVSEWPIVP